MWRARFDRLCTVRLVSESRTGRTEICQGPDGTRWVKLCITSLACQREFLDTLDETIPVRLENGALELLLPWHEGASLRQWRYERTPTLGQRRDVCMSLLAQQVETRGKLPPCLTVLAAKAENLTIENTAAFLQFLPEFRHWEPGIEEPQAVCAMAGVICQVLAPEGGRWPCGQLPEEIQLLYRRQKEQDYTNWGQLQRDVFAIPDEPPHMRGPWHFLARRLQDGLSRWGTHILRVLAAVLLAAALLSLWSAYRRRENKTGPVWLGMPLVGDQDLRSGEDGK